jgi:hypothetical protein
MMIDENLIITEFPEFVLLDKKYRKSLKPLFLSLKDGISELTFDSLLIHNGKFNHKISKIPNSNSYILVGNDEHDEKIKTFFSILQGEENLFENQNFVQNILPQCFNQFKFWKLMSQSQFEKYSELLQKMNYKVEFDRDNSDYIYNRTDLANLPGKDFHKKKNLVNAFLKNENIIVKNLDSTNTNDALKILNLWKEGRDLNQTDYYQCIDALKDIENNNSILSGIIAYVEENPVAWSLGEFLPDEKTYLVHFEKGDSNYKGVYQFINNETAKNLPETVLFINREQDLGDEGLRQAKMTYRPCGFINKYLAYKV